VKAAEYLRSRGWIYCPEEGFFEDGWYDPLFYGGMTPRTHREKWSYLAEVEALAIQRARDEEKAREAWVRFAARFASTFVAETEHAQGGYWLEDHSAARKADAMLALYRARFCPEVEL